MRRTAAAFAAVLIAIAAVQPATAADQAGAPTPSLDPKIKFKDGERYLRDLSTALDLPRDSICKELSQYDCFKDAFRIVLGGTDAANLGVNQPLEEQALTAPIALDRVALHVCITRIDKDIAEPKSAVLLRAAPRGRPNAAWMRKSAAGFYDKILDRDATPLETDKIVAFYDQVARTGGKANPNAVKDWATLSCFAVASSLENVFY